MSGLHGGDGAFFGAGDFDELTGAASLGGAEIEVVADEEEEGIVLAKVRSAVDGVGIAEGGGLFDKGEAGGVGSGSGAVGGFIAGADDDADALNAGAEDFLEDDGQSGLAGAVAVHEGLKGQGALMFASGGDEGLGDFHAGSTCGRWRRASTGGSSKRRGGAPGERAGLAAQNGKESRANERANLGGEAPAAAQEAFPGRENGFVSGETDQQDDEHDSGHLIHGVKFAAIVEQVS